LELFEASLCGRCPGDVDTVDRFRLTACIAGRGDSHCSAVSLRGPTETLITPEEGFQVVSIYRYWDIADARSSIRLCRNRAASASAADAPVLASTTAACSFRAAHARVTEFGCRTPIALIDGDDAAELASTTKGAMAAPLAWSLFMCADVS
jgi:hypothetical protein